MRWVDYAKGIAILLVVVGHVLRGLIGSSILKPSVAVTLTDGWIYAFHMPLFFFLSGLFAASAASRPWKPFTVIKLKTLAYPYFVWATIQTTLEAVMASYTNTPGSLYEILSIPFDPPSQFWFIYALFFMAFVHAAVYKLRVSAPVFLLLAVAFYATSDLVGLGPWRAPRLVRNCLIYFALGTVASDVQMTARLRQVRTQLLVSVVILGYLLVLAIVAYDANRTLLSRPVCAILGGTATICLAIVLERFDAARSIHHWGRLSLQIYLAHVVVGSGVRIVLYKFVGYEQVAVHFVLGVLAAIYGPILLNWASQRVGFKYLFSLRPS